jgi:O-antigen ligase
LIVPVALAGGGFEVTTRHIAALGAWLVVVGVLVLGAASNAKLGRPFYWVAGLLGGLALFSALSSLWSGSVELSVIEADRVLAYLGFFVAAFLVAQTNERRQRFAEGLTIALATVALLGLCSRLLPHVLEVGNALGTGPRLRYPLGYWNANGAVCGIAIAMLLWTSRQALWNWLRWLSVAALPAVLLTLYFTYSRGGLLALVVAVGCLLALSRDRLWLLGTLAAGVAGVAPAILAVQDRRDLADNIASQAAVDQGVTVLLILIAGTALTLLGFWLLRRGEARDGHLAGRAVAASRSPALLSGLALTVGLAAIVVAIAVGGRAWEQFSSPDLYFPDKPEEHFGDVSGAGRHDFWRVAIDAFADDPVRGQGAGVYQFSWEQDRSIEMAIHDAHSLYLESFAELGVLGGTLVLGLVGGVLWWGFGAWRSASGRERERNAVLLAVVLALAVGAALDWFWELTGVEAIFFLAAGVLIGARCAQLAPDERRATMGKTEGRRYGLALAGLGVAWIAALALVGPLLVEREVKASQKAAAEGDIASAVSHADTARSIEPWAASPYVQLGLIAEFQGDYATAAARLTQAIDREDSNWQLYYLRSGVLAKAGDSAGAEADLERARELNPLEPLLEAGAG